jgi:hypothetical protein
MISGNRPRNTHIFERAANDLYIELSRVSERLFAVETFPGVILDPCCGTGTIPQAAQAAGLSSYASDIADHGYGDIQTDCGNLHVDGSLMWFVATITLRRFVAARSPPHHNRTHAVYQTERSAVGSLSKSSTHVDPG